MANCLSISIVKVTDIDSGEESYAMVARDEYATLLEDGYSSPEEIRAQYKDRPSLIRHVCSQSGFDDINADEMTESEEENIQITGFAF